MSEYAVSDRMRRVHEIRERVTGRREDDEDDDVDYFKRKRIQRDALQEQSRASIQAHRERDKLLREQMGYTAWSEMKQKERQDNARRLEVQEQEQQRKDHRAKSDERREELRAIAARSEDLDDMKRKWLEEDIARSKAAHEDEKYRREVQWSRQDKQKEAVKRERERYREERRLRDEATAVSHHVSDNEWRFKQEQEPLDVAEWAKVQEMRKQAHNRRLVRTALGVEKTETDPYAEEIYRETARRKKNWDSYQKRLYQDENEMEKMKTWYTTKSLDRADFKREAIKQAHSRPASRYHY